MNPLQTAARTRIRASQWSGALLVAGAILWLIQANIVLAADNAAPSRLVYKTVGARQLALELDYPPGWLPTDKRPAIVFFFGGSWTTGTPAQFAPQAGYFAKRGLVCVRADYRLRLKDNVQPDKCVEDALSAMRWVRSHAAQLGIDPNRIVAAGGSAGGHLAACTFFADGISAPDDNQSVSPKPNALLLYNPVLNMIAARNSPDKSVVAGMDDALLKRISPVFHVQRQMPPTLIIDGTKDRLYPEIHAFVQRSQSVGAPIEARYTEGQPHGFFNQHPWLQKTTAEADEFLRKIGYLGNDPKVPLPSEPGTD